MVRIDPHPNGPVVFQIRLQRLVKGASLLEKGQTTGLMDLFAKLIPIEDIRGAVARVA